MVVSVVITIVLALTAISTLPQVSANRDGFNMYKDYLRGKNEDFSDGFIRDDFLLTPKFLYFYRASPNLVLPVLGDLLQSSELFSKKSALFGKRTFNQFKNYMLTREPPEMQFALENVGGDVLKGPSELMGRPIPVRSSLLAGLKREPQEEGEPKRALFSWSVSSSNVPRLRADLSEYYKMTTPRSTSADLLERLNNKQGQGH